jgi:hypothetical protein
MKRVTEKIIEGLQEPTWSLNITKQKSKRAF